MRIISDFKDYYDFPQKYGFDPKIQYLRKSRFFHFGRNKQGWTENINPTDKNRWLLTSISRSYFPDPDSRTIGFCGKLYEFFIYKDGDGVKIFKTKDEALEWGAKILKVDLKKRKKNRRRRWWGLNGKEPDPLWGTPVEQMPTRYSSDESTKKRYTEMFEKAPLWIEVGGDKIEINFCFRSHGLESFMDATQLYQDLSQYMSNVWAINQPEIPVPSDKDMVSIKGFDKKRQAEKEMNSIKEDLALLNPDALLADGFDDALIGYSVGHVGTRAVYDVDLCIDVLCKHMEHMDYDAAAEHFDYNIQGSYVGEEGPIFVKSPVPAHGS